jgi:hypothetical protein
LCSNLNIFVTPVFDRPAPRPLSQEVDAEIPVLLRGDICRIVKARIAAIISRYQAAKIVADRPAAARKKGTAPEVQV